MNDIVTAILAINIFCSGYILGFVTGGIYLKNKDEEKENEYIGEYNEKLS